MSATLSKQPLTTEPHDRPITRPATSFALGLYDDERRTLALCAFMVERRASIAQRNGGKVVRAPQQAALIYTVY